MESTLTRILYKFRREKLDSSWKNRNQIIIVVRILDLSKRKKNIFDLVTSSQNLC